MNITTLQGFEAFKASLLAPPGAAADSDGATSRVDLVLSCVDNYEARMTINQVSVEAGVCARFVCTLFCACSRETGLAGPSLAGRVRF